MTSYVYFISDSSGSIKIGFSANPAERLIGLKVGTTCDLKLLGFVEGSRSQEKQLHAFLADYRINGEWFDDTPAVRGLMDRVLGAGLEASGFPPDADEQSGHFTVALAQKLAEAIIRHSGCTVSNGDTDVFGVPVSLLWRLTYRPGKKVYADELSSLKDAALRAMDYAMSRIQKERHWVEDVCEDDAAFFLRYDHNLDRVEFLKAELAKAKAEAEVMQ